MIISFLHDIDMNIVLAARVSPGCCSLALGTRISGFGTTFCWLQDVLLMHMQGVVLL